MPARRTNEEAEADTPLARLRALCLALPEATEKLTWEETPTFRVREKIFAMYAGDRGDNGRPALHCKAPPGAQHALVGGNPDQFFVPPYVGVHGWIGVYLDQQADWDGVADLVTESYRMTAPKRLAAQLDG
jgi:predicted DNA-binding protein (MmcQ/YjbR family)